MNEIVFTRDYNLPVSLLYKAWTDPEHLKIWWGPEGFTNTFEVFDLAPGGKWLFTMHGPDGKDYPNESHFVTIKENELLVFDHISEPQFRIEAIFSAKDNHSSQLEWRMIFVKEKVLQSIRDFITEKNKENLDRLEAELNKMKKSNA